MPFVQAKCPECGGFVEVDNEKRLGVCQHCGQPYVVEEAIQTFNTYYNITTIYNTTNNYGDGAVVNVYEDKTKDFVIEAGVLKEYHGASVDVVIPDSVTEIGSRCFKDLKIKSVIIPNSVTSIGDSAFSGCTSLESITIPNSVTNIGNHAFSGCTNLESIIIPESVTSIGKFAFSCCRNIISIAIPDGVSCVGEALFCFCSSLKNVTLSNNISSLPSYEDWDPDFPSDYTGFFQGCSNLETIVIPNSVTIIDDCAFANCSSLSSITIGNGVTCIGEKAFKGCTKLTSVTIPSNVKHIGNYALEDYWKAQGLCSRCGGTFRGLFTLKCSKCENLKDY